MEGVNERNERCECTTDGVVEGSVDGRVNERCEYTADGVLGVLIEELMKGVNERKCMLPTNSVEEGSMKVVSIRRMVLGGVNEKC